MSLQPARAIRDDRERDQRQAKAELVLASLATADAVVLAPSDWALGTDWVLGQVSAQGVPLLAGNLTCGATTFPGHTVVERGGRRIGVVGVALAPVEGCEVADPAAALASAVAATGPVDALIGLVPATDEKQVGQLVGGLPFTTVVAAHGRYPTQGGVQVGSSWSFGAGSRGKYLGVLDLAFVPGGTAWAPVGMAETAGDRLGKLEERLTNLHARIERETDPARKQAFGRQVPRLEADIQAARSELEALGGSTEGMHQLRPDTRELSASVADEPTWAARVDALNRGLSEAMGQQTVVARRGPEGSAYVGADVCAGCHAEASAQWRTTPHARAHSTLAADDHAADEGCVRCHVTGYGQEGGPQAPVEVGGLRDVQCEACHGPGRDHVASPAEVAPPQVPSLTTCRGCHDNENDMGAFDPATYWPKVLHTRPATP